MAPYNEQCPPERRTLPMALEHWFAEIARQLHDESIGWHCDETRRLCLRYNGATSDEMPAEVPYQFDMYARSGCPPYHYNITGGTPVPGLTLSTVNDIASGGIGAPSPFVSPTRT